MNGDRMIVLNGYMGSGKTTTGKALEKRLRLPLADLDEMIEQGEGKTIAEIFREGGEASFRRLETEYLERILKEGYGILALGGGTVLGKRNQALLGAGLPEERKPFFVWLSATPETIFERLKGDNSRPLLFSGSDEEKKRGISQMMKERESFYRLFCDLKIDVDGRSVDEIAAWIAQHL